MYSKWHTHWHDNNPWTHHKEITNHDWKMHMKEKIRFQKSLRWPLLKTEMTVIAVFSYGHLSDSPKSDSLPHTHPPAATCDPLAKCSQITIVPMFVSSKTHHRNNPIDKKGSHLIPRPPSWDDRNLQLRSSVLPLWEYMYEPINILSLMFKDIWWLWKIWIKKTIIY